MTIPRKGSRLITVHAMHYRWMVTGNDMVINVIVEKEGAKGQKLRVDFDYPNLSPHGSMMAQKRNVTPGVVIQCILYALQEGWEPDVKGTSAMVLDGEKIVPIPP
jgi:hypothetical protein